MINTQEELLKDMEAVKQISIVPNMLEVVCQVTGMGFAAIARVTQDRWLACSVRDEVQFGLKAGDELKIETTLCNEIRDSRKAIIISNVAEDPVYKDHHTPKIYNLQSYISIPIILKNGALFGTLCAIDSKPKDVSEPKVISTLTMFAELLAFHLESLDIMERSYQTTLELNEKNRVLENANFDLDSFVYTASHDLKSPVSNIEGLLNALSEIVSREEINREEVQLIIGMMRKATQRFATTITDLTTIVEVDKNSKPGEYEEVNILEIVEDVKQDLNYLILESNAKIEIICEEEASVTFSKKNLKSILYNLVSNAIKYRSPERQPEVLVKLDKTEDKVSLSVTDNGLGIPPDKQDKVFSMYQRFHNHVEGSGLGLYLVKRIIDNIKGRIEVHSSLGKGTTFTVVFLSSSSAML